jgi:hypothetical protein
MVSGNVDDLGAGATHPMQGLDHPIVRTTPVRAALRHPPVVNVMFLNVHAAV